jgi:hypothetical protein
MSADISNNRVKKGRPARPKKKAADLASEVEVARQLISVGTDIDEYDPRFPEKQERIYFQQKLDKSSARARASRTGPRSVSFKKLPTFDEFKAVENRREQCFATGDSEIFHSLYPEIDHQMSPIKPKTGGLQRPMSSPLIRSKPVSFQLTFVTPADLDTRPERPPAQFEKHVASQAVELWKTALTALRLRGKEILYEDVSALSRSWRRSGTLREMVGYVSILLGLRSGDPKMTQRSVFKELYTLLKFFREVRRARGAHEVVLIYKSCVCISCC